MFFKKAKRRLLIDILTGDIDKDYLEIRSSESLPEAPISEDEFYIVWDKNPNEIWELPVMIIVGNGDLKDFFAWASTYFPNFKPFTAYFRVIVLDTAINLNSWHHSPSLDGLGNCYVGLIIGEVLSRLSNLKDASSYPTLTFLTTASYVFTRALALGAREQELELVCERLNSARKITEQPERKLRVDQIEQICRILWFVKSRVHDDSPITSNSASFPLIVDACCDVIEQGKISKLIWSKLTRDYSKLNDAQQLMAATREERVSYFQDLIKSDISKSVINDETERSFIYGYIASMIGPGSMSHAELVAQILPQYPTILMWYGLCAGLFRKDELLNSFKALGQTLVREFLRYESLTSRPLADIEISELQVLMGRNSKSADFRTFISNQIMTEILPGVSIYLFKRKLEPGHQAELFPKKDSKKIDEELLMELGSVLQDAQHIYGRLSSAILKEESTKNIPKKRRKKPRKAK